MCPVVEWGDFWHRVNVVLHDTSLQHNPTKDDKIMKNTVTFYHAGCPVCLDAQQAVESLVDRNRFELEIVHLGETPDRLPAAEAAGLKSVPALLSGGRMVHLNFGADVAALKG